MSTTAQPQPQLGLYESTIEDPDLERTLESRQKLKEQLGELRKQYKELDDKAKASVGGELELGIDVKVRCGRFVLSQSNVAARTVSFETSPTSRVQIRLLADA